MTVSAVHGYVDRLDVLPAAFAGPILPSGAAIVFTGWALHAGRPARRIELAVERGPSFAATSGLRRPDVAAAFGSDALDGGFQAYLPTAVLAAGTHAVRVLADGTPIGDSTGLTIASANSFLQLDSLPPQSAHVDEALVLGCDPQGTSTPSPARRGDTIVVRGWADRPPGEAPHRAVLGVVDDGVMFVGSAGLPREDVAAFFGDPRRREVGFRLFVPLRHLEPGEHVLRLVFAAAPDRPRSRAEHELRFVVLP